MCNSLMLEIPGSLACICPGVKVKIGRFSKITWLVLHGWYSWGGNRPVCGWYLTNINNPSEVKPLQKPDLDDIYLIET